MTLASVRCARYDETMSLQAWLVSRIDADGQGNNGPRGNQVMVHARDEESARYYGADMLGVSAQAVTATRYNGPTMGVLERN